MKNLFKTKNLSVKEFIIKTTVLASLFVWVLCKKVSDFLAAFISLLVEPFFSLDLNENGEPDLKELMSYHLNIGNRKIPIGRIIMEFTKLLLHLLLIYLLIYIILNKTNLITLK